MDKLFESLYKTGCDVRMFEKLSCHTSIKIGGRVKYLVLPNDVFPWSEPSMFWGMSRFK